MTEKVFSRRSFMVGAAAAGVFGWLHDSPAITARILRGTIDDAQRGVTKIALADFSVWSDKSIDICWIGHATVLINFYGVHILTDPVLFEQIGAQLGICTLGRKRLVSAPLDPWNLPRIDLVLLSHAHMDHMDMPSLARMPAAAKVLTAPQTSDILAHFPFRSPVELRWGESATIATPSGDLGVEALEVKHWGARWKYDSHRGYVGYLLTRGGKSILFGGDTAYTGTFARLRNRKIDAAIMPIGSYASAGGNHCTPEETVRMADACGAYYIVPVHHSTFPIGREPLEEPLTRLEGAVESDRIAIKQIGQTWRLPA